MFFSLDHGSSKRYRLLIDSNRGLSHTYHLRINRRATQGTVVLGVVIETIGNS